VTYPDAINALVNVNATDTLQAGGHAARHNSTNTALVEVKDYLDGQLPAKADVRPAQNVQAANYTFVADDATRLTVMTGGSAVTIPPASSVAWPTGTQLAVLNQGSASVTVTAGSGVTLNGSGTALAQYAGGVAVRTGSDVFTFVPFSGAGAGSASAPSSVEYLVIAGGGGGGASAWTTTGASGGGGGAGGYRCSVLGENSGGGASAESPLAVTAGTSYTVTIGAGGAGAIRNGVHAGAGSNSVFSTVTSTGGGRGGTGGAPTADGGAGGSGGGGVGGGGGAGTANQGRAGGDLTQGSGVFPAGGGGGASTVGGNGTSTVAGNGGAGVSSSITGSSVGRAGGGGGGTFNGVNVGTATDGGGSAVHQSNGADGTANRGGGGGGGSWSGSVHRDGGSGGSGVVIIRHRKEFATATTTGSPTITTAGLFTVYTFNASGTISWAA
jgi:hypothetical protein